MTETGKRTIRFGIFSGLRRFAPVAFRAASGDLLAAHRVPGLTRTVNGTGHTEEKARRKAQRKARRERSWLSWFSSKEEEVKTPPPPPTAESIIKHIEFEEDGFTDGMYEGNPGNQGVYPSKYDEDEELGVIRIDLATISVVKKKFSSTKTKPKTDRRRPIRQKSAKKKSN